MLIIKAGRESGTSRSRVSVYLCVGALTVAAACSPDVVGAGYEDPDPNTVGAGGATSDSAGGSDGSPPTPTEAGGASSAPLPLAVGGAATASGGEPATAPTGSGGTPSVDHPASSNCDLSGRWIVTQRSVVEAIGVQQALRMWFYFDFAQSGTQVIATKGLDCGYDVVPLTAVAGAADLHRAWPGIMANNSMTGRKGTITATSSGCSVSFEPSVTVDGATVAYFRDPSRTMPGPSDQATSSTPGWEDWDSDGNPGISYHLSGVASGTVFVAARHTNTWSGTISGTNHSFTVPNTPKQEEDLLGYDGSPLLTTTSSVAADRSLHFAEFARLDATQGTGDDTATCAAMRSLAPTLTPHADEKPVQ